LGSGVFNLITNKGKPTNFSFFSFSSETSKGFSFSKEPQIIPNDKWQNVLVGKWNYYIIKITNDSETNIEGSVEYLSDGRFLRRVTYTSYNENGDIFFKAGGKVKGTWQVNKNQTWSEIIENCVIQKSIGSNGFNTCNAYFNGVNIYGAKESGTSDYEITLFNNSKIEIKAKDLTDGKTDTYSFTRIGDFANN